MSVRLLLINGLAIPLHASVELSQSYSPVSATSRTRMGDGSLKQQVAWYGKVLTTISGKGVIPAGFDDVDFTQPLTLSCIEPRAITSVSNLITIPSARRSDAGSEPYGRALVDGQWVSTPVAMSTDLATLTPVTGATQYQVVWFPELTVFADPPSETKDTRSNDYSWQLVAEET